MVSVLFKAEGLLEGSGSGPGLLQSLMFRLGEESEIPDSGR